MTFFQGASNVNVTGGEFNEVRGNYIVYDQSRHHSNVNSFNTTNRTILNSGNNNSSVYHGVPPQNARHPSHTNLGANHAPSGSQGAQASYANGIPLFPPPSSPPAMMQPQYLPPGSRIQNVDSYNTRNENMINVNNDNSAEYGIPTPRKRRKDRQRPGMHQEDNVDEDEEAVRPQQSAARGPASNRYSPSNHCPPYGPYAFPTTSSAQFSPGHVQGMGPDFQKTFETLMQQVQEHTTPKPAQEEDSEASSEEEEQDPNMTAPVSLNTGMANLSLDEDRPAYSRVKSDPQNPQNLSPASAHTASPSNPEPVRPGSVPYLPEHVQQPFVIPPNPPPPTAGPYAAYAPAPIPPYGQHPATSSAPPPRHSSNPTSPYSGTAPRPYAPPQGAANGAYGGASMPPPPPRPSGPVFNTINGDYTKVDQSVHSTNIGSGNTHNTFIQDSYNDNSVKSYAQPASKPKRQGRRRSEFP